MNKFKKALVAAGVSAAMLGTGFIGTTSAFATVTDKKDITFSNYTTGDVVRAYRILNIESKGDDGELVYSVYKPNQAALHAGLNAARIYPASSSESDLIKAITGKDASGNPNLNSSNIDAFATGFKNAYATMSEASKTLTNADEEAGTAADNKLNVTEGYYLIAHITIGDTSKDTKSKYMVVNVDSDGAEVALKNGTVTLVKKVQDNGDTGDTQGTNWNDSADYNIGNDVPFQLTGTLPENWDDFSTFAYEFVDTLSGGLTLDQSTLTVTIDGVDVTSQFAVKATETRENDAADGKLLSTAISVKAADLKKVTLGSDKSITADSTIVVYYKAKLNSGAVIGTAGNPNVAQLVFSNDPYTASSTGTTPEDKVKVFTYELQGTKTFTPAPNEDDLPIFMLYRGSVADDNKVGTSNVVKNEGGTFTFGFQGLDAGTYVLVETYTPAGFNTAANKTFTITATHSVEADDPTCVLAVTGDAGLAEGTGAAIAVINTGGSQLPSTGGMGTTILYTVGGLIVLAAAAGLTIALRKRNA